LFFRPAGRSLAPPRSSSRHDVSEIGVEVALWLQCRNGRVVGGGREGGRYALLVEAFWEEEERRAAREHFEITVHGSLLGVGGCKVCGGKRTWFYCAVECPFEGGEEVHFVSVQRAKEVRVD